MPCVRGLPHMWRDIHDTDRVLMCVQPGCGRVLDLKQTAKKRPGYLVSLVHALSARGRYEEANIIRGHIPPGCPVPNEESCQA